MTITRYQIITLALIVVFGFLGFWLSSLGDDGEWLSTFCVVPPLGAFFVATMYWEKKQK